VSLLGLEIQEATIVEMPQSFRDAARNPWVLYFLPFNPAIVPRAKYLPPSETKANMSNAIASGMATMDETSPATTSLLRSLAPPPWGYPAREREDAKFRLQGNVRCAINPVRRRRARVPARMRTIGRHPGPHHGFEIWQAFCNAYWTAQRSAPMQIDLLLVWAAILGGLTFLAMATD
jgi:hypothetical protein